MPGFPSRHNPLISSQLYIKEKEGVKSACGKEEEKSEKRIHYVQEEGNVVERQNCSTLVQMGGVDESCVVVNVKKFMQVKRNCQWIKVFTYVDETLLPEPCSDYKYTAVDIQQSEYELLSMPFKLNNPSGKIQVVVKTFGPGKKWPDYTFKYDYFNSRNTPARLLPAHTSSTKSFDFRDVVKRSETLMDKLKEVQYSAEDRALREKIEAEEEEKRKACDLTEMIKRRPAETVKVARRRSVTPDEETQEGEEDNFGSSNILKRARGSPSEASSRDKLNGPASSRDQNTKNQPAPLMRFGRDVTKAPILDRRW